MAQKTDLNISPYYDDFDPSKNFYKVLFKPGFPVQARELTNLQSILQNQVEEFGTHIFKEGSIVIPGAPSYDQHFNSVRLNASQFGTDISVYIDSFLNKVIEGQSSGVTGTIDKIVLPDGGDVRDLTIYVKYLNADKDNSTRTIFLDGESLICSENIVYGNTTITAGTAFATLVSSNATSIGSAAHVESGVYFIRGTFVDVQAQTIILDNYTNTPSYKVGFQINETIVGAKEDDSLYDNAKGFTNYAAPGADRFKIDLVLTKKLLTDNNVANFFEILRIQDGDRRFIIDKTRYNIIRDWIAGRTYDESGNYSVERFNIDLENSLNNRLGNNGVFFAGQNTEQGGTPSEDLMCYKVSGGKAYVRGYDVNPNSITILDADKPRDVEKIDTANLPFEMGSVLVVNNLVGQPQYRKVVELYAKLNTAALGTKIGEARVYSCTLKNSSYAGVTTKWNLRLYDVQTYTKLTINQAVSNTEVVVSSYIKGLSSGASGYSIQQGGASTTLLLRQTSGTFIRGEAISINGNTVYPRTITQVETYNSNDILTVKQTAAAPYTEDFIANASLERRIIPNIDEAIANAATITAYSQPFTGIEVDDIVIFNNQDQSDPFYNRVTAVSADSLTLTVAAIGSNVAGVYHGALTSGAKNVQLRLGQSTFKDNQGELFEKLPNPNVASIDFSSSVLPISAQITGEGVSGANVLDTSILNVKGGDSVAITTAFFEAYGIPRYSVHYGNQTAANSIGTVTSDNFELQEGGSEVKIYGLTASDSNTVVSITAKKQGIRSKIKNYVKSQFVDVVLSRLPESGSTEGDTLNDKLSFNNVAYGLRVQDEEISLNVPDAVKVLAVYESIDGAQPTLDTISFSATANVGTNALLGENIIGDQSKAIARVVTNQGSSPSTGNSNKLGIVYLNENRFVNFEKVRFEESNITTFIEGINNSDTEGSYSNISQSFTLDQGQRDQYYDYSRIVRKSSASIPSKRLLVIYDRYDVSANDTGDIYSVNSYDKRNYTDNIPLIGENKVRATDVLDFRPRPTPFTSTTASPFDFAARTTKFNTEPQFLVAPNESTLLGYEYYLGRIDKIYLSEYGVLELLKGQSSINPKPPVAINNSMELTTIILPPYLYNPDDAQIIMTDNRRYTMRDIGVLEDRIEQLETVTTLSLLEIATESLTIQDAQGNDRFKSGFFADNFKTTDLINSDFSQIEVDTVNGEIKPIVAKNSLQNQLMPASNIVDSELDFGTNFELLDSNVQKTGSIVTLAYEEVDYLEQALATRVENINPFHVISYNGTIDLSPRVDAWIRTIRLPESITNVTLTNTIRNRRVGGNQNRTETNVETTQGSVVSFDLILSAGDEQWMRSRNTEFDVNGIRPFNRHYQFLDGNSDVDFIPKLLEITPEVNGQIYGSTGTFKVGETVKGISMNSDLNAVETIIEFRVAQSNHQSGSFNNPDKTYNLNPYSQTEVIPDEYTTSSKVLNIDIVSLTNEAQGLYSGYVTIGLQLVGQESGAIAYVKDLRLISNEYGKLQGSFFIKDPHTDPVPTVRIPTGRKTYRLTSSSTNQTPLKGSALGSAAQATYRSFGTLITRQVQTTNTTIETTTITEFEAEQDDPLAQSFTVAGNIQAPNSQGPGDDEHGVFITSIDLFFARKDTGNQPVHVQIRTMELGTPTMTVLGRTVTLLPEDITVNSTAQVATNVKFHEPIYLAPGAEYAVVLLAPTSDQFEMWIARMGETTINTQSLPDASAVSYTQQWAIGSLFLSQNGSIWTPSQREDLKFKLYRAKFTSNSGSVFFTNPTLNVSNGYVSRLENNPIITLPKTGYVGITTIGSGGVGISTLTSGRKLVGSTNDGVSAVVVGTGASAYAVTKTTSGLNYKASSAVETYNITGQGEGLKLDITVSGTDNAINTIAINGGGGEGYKTGDVVGIATTSAGNQGRGAEISITDINSNVNRLYLSNIQGQNATGSFPAGGVIRYSHPTEGIKTILAGGPVFDADGLQLDGTPYDGKHFLVNQFDHAMHSSNNKVELSDIQSNTLPSLLSADISSDEIASISVASTSVFSTFEGIPVGVGSTGYVKVDEEIIGYKSMTPNGSGGGTLDDITRAVDGTQQLPHFTPSSVHKYELNGVSLRRINTQHQLANLPIDLDSYYVGYAVTMGKNRTTDGSGISELSFNEEGFAGGSLAKATRNIQFDSITPNFRIITPSTLTEATASIRTVTGTSVGGNEISFEDKGFENVQLNTLNQLTTPRLVCSKVNADAYLTTLERNKGFITALRFTSDNEYISPVVLTDSSFSEFGTNRMNNPVTDYSNSADTRSWRYDKHRAIYVSQQVNLDKPADGLKVFVAGYRDETADFRVLYSLIRPDSSGVSQEFEFFPGYDNLDDTTGDGFGNVVRDPAKNDGLPDSKVDASLDNEFRDYQFTADGLGDFVGYTIKIVISGTNQAKPVRIKDIRTIAVK
tara:strand:+ start:18727 stop:26040 length:7314 start_codon:yes stop_codon:yes gene_type:complete